MNLRKILALMLAMTFVLTSFAGCQSTTTDDTSADSEVEEESTAGATDVVEDVAVLGTDAYPGTADTTGITVNLGSEPSTLNTLTETYSHEFVITRHTMENLVMLDENDNVMPGVAETWDVSEDGLNYTFYLREGMTWTNGEPVTANDFTFAWEQLITPETAADYAYFAYIFKNAEAFYNGEVGIEEVGFVAVDDYTLEVTLENPTAYALFIFSFGTLAPVNETFYTEVGAANYNLEAEYFCTNGAFTVESWTHDSNIVLAKNDDFYRADEISLETITFAMITDSNTALNSFKAGEIDIIDVSGDRLSIMESEGYPVSTYSNGSEYHVLFNTNNEYISNVNLRKAIDLAYSRADYIEYVLQNNSTPAISFTAPSVAGADGTSFATALEVANGGALNNVEADTELALEYLAVALEELGCTVEDLSANLSMNCGDSDLATQQAAFFQEQLRVNLGIEISIYSMTTKAQSSERSAGNYVMDFTGWGPDYNDPMTFLDMWVTDGGNNSTGWSNERYDELIALATVETDLDLRQEYFIECEQILNTEVPISNTYWSFPSYIVSGKISGNVVRTTFQDMNYTYVTLG